MLQSFKKVARQNRLVGLVISLVIIGFIFSLTSSAFAKGVDPEEKIYYYLNDHLGGIDAVLDEEGNVVERRDYLPYGSERMAEGSTDGSTGSPASEDYGFTGKELDEETGLYYYGARYYDPVVGRFVTQDRWEGELENPQSLNKYNYGFNNPVNNIDPSGNVVESAWDFFNDVLDFGIVIKNEVEIIKDATQYTYGHITQNQELKERAQENLIKNTDELNVGLKDLVFDTAATAIPFVPAGLTKGEKIIKVNQKAQKTTKLIADKITGYTKHGINQSIGRDGGRGVNIKSILDAIKNPKQAIKQIGDKFKFKGATATVITNKNGEIITTYGKPRDKSVIKNIIKKVKDEN